MRENNIVQRIGLGDMPLEETLASMGVGAMIPTMAFAALVLYIFTSGSAAQERRKQLSKAKADYENRVAKIKSEHRRLRL